MNESLEALLTKIKQQNTAENGLTETTRRILEALAYCDGAEDTRTENLADLCTLAATVEDPEVLAKGYSFLSGMNEAYIKKAKKKEAEAELMKAYIAKRADYYESTGKADCKAEAVTMACMDYNELQQKINK